MESLSSYARQFLSMMEKPDVDTIEGLSPARSRSSRNRLLGTIPASTVGTVTEIYGLPAPAVRAELASALSEHPAAPPLAVPQTVSQMAGCRAGAAREDQRFMLLGPVIRGRKVRASAGVRAAARARVRTRARRWRGSRYRRGAGAGFAKQAHIEAVVDRSSAPISSNVWLESFETALRAWRWPRSWHRMDDAPVPERLFGSFPARSATTA